MVAEDLLRRGFSLAPIVNFLGLELVSAEDGAAQVRLPFREELIQGLGVIHGGVLSLLGDSACWFAAASEREEILPTSVELKINFLKPAKAVNLVAKARVVRSGRRISTVSFEVFDEAAREIVAVGLSTLLVSSDVEHAGIELD